MYDQIRQDTLFIIFYSIVTAMAAMASCYLLFRRANAIAPDVTPPVRLRRWTAAFLAAFALNHIWYMPIFFLSSSEDIRLCDLVGGLLDSMTVFPLMIIVLLTMLQDRHRPLWPVALMMAPVVVGSTLCVATLSYVFLPALYVYILLMCMGLIVYMVRASMPTWSIRRCGRVSCSWLSCCWCSLSMRLSTKVWFTYTPCRRSTQCLSAISCGEWRH